MKKEVEAVWKRYKKKTTAPGEDGLSYRYLYESRDAIDPFVTAILNLMRDQRILPSNMQNVLIKLLPKKNDKKDIKNWRPISLMNGSLKIMAALINDRLIDIMPTIISKGQFGFIKDRNMDDGVAYMNSIFKQLELATKDSCEASVAIDFEKAFDRASMTYLEKVLEAVGFPTSTINQIMSLNSKQNGKLIINEEISEEEFEFKNGIRQGSPLSPNLFLLVIEPLLCRNESSITIPGFFEEIFR